MTRVHPLTWVGGARQYKRSLWYDSLQSTGQEGSEKAEDLRNCNVKGFLAYYLYRQDVCVCVYNLEVALASISP